MPGVPNAASPVKRMAAPHRSGENGVQMEGGELRNRADTVRDTATFAYLSPHSPRTGSVYFARDPRAIELEPSA